MPTVSLFIPCLVDLVLPRVGECTATLLSHLGCKPIYHSEQTCCGLMAFNGGHRDEARRLARRFIRVFEHDPLIVSPSGSCVHMVKQRYAELFADEPAWRARALALAPRVYELSQFVVDFLGVQDVGAADEVTVAYHESCSTLNALGVSAQPKALIRAVRGATLKEWQGADVCCGFGGTFANSFAPISSALVRQKVAFFLESGADLLVMCDPGCLLNIGGYLHRHHPDKQAMHLAQFLADRLPDGPARDAWS
ncbi:(Fe-S)-binding protein [Desulfatitalea alkaliphila]|uniref:(Fe-S)-binding protein n=1 Tax=Desulfatitalea alkaliphila TaxID=2929485 RepID=A0AA41UHM0_9BACT|nr:(Fe-S)-binding protein [Desulfatitalea alkaliphila]MCJ8499169.1 (Fe-S)-binding protein [Desulfatitalea alkaliphila]